MGQAFSFGKDLWDPSHRFETSWILPPYALFATRALICIYIFVTRFFIMGYECTHEEFGGCTAVQNEFSYFTVLTFWGLAFYYLVASIHTFTYARWSTALLDRLPRPLQALHALFYSTVTTLPFLVTIVYWGILYKGPWFPRQFNAWSNVTQHGLNSAFALFEIIVPRTSPQEWVHMFWLIILLAGYLGVAYITHATKGFYTYSFLDPVKNGSGITAAYIIGIAVAVLIVFLLVKGLIWLRVFVTEKKLGMDGKFARSSSSRRMNDTEMDIINKHGH